uniref:Uncharacterized protein n=1 Tax=Tanacetum cinerariifolium TaxID=118510 RepID=A0A6L2J123_TANCI|nr:hypothetical protein [Tanacetum cinerariifolium]
MTMLFASFKCTATRHNGVCSTGGTLRQRDHSFGMNSMTLRFHSNIVKQLKCMVRRNCNGKSAPSAEGVVNSGSSNGSVIVESEEALENDQKLLFLNSDASFSVHAGMCGRR